MKITLQNLTKTFPARGKKGAAPVTAVDHFNFEIPDGQLIGLLGPSGCGKSTTLNMICGLERPTEGKIFFGDQDVTNLPPENRGVGMVFQNYALYPHLTVRQNILFPLQNLKGKDKLSKEEMEKRAADAAKLVQIDELMERKPGELSGGQQQRVAIARALVKMPRVLLLDEPLSNLDARLRLATREEIRRIQRTTGITTVFVTHDQDEAMSISDHIVVMERGKVQQIGKPQEVYDNPCNLFVAKFLGTPPINVFRGEISEGKLFVGADPVLNIRFRQTAQDTADHSVSNTEDVKNQTGAPGTPSDSGQTASFTAGNSFGGENDREVYIGIRPEGFVLDEKGPLSCSLSRVEIMGRDITVVSTHPACENAAVRSIISAESRVNPAVGIIRFSLKPEKVFVFDKQTGERIPFYTKERKTSAVKPQSAPDGISQADEAPLSSHSQTEAAISGKAD